MLKYGWSRKSPADREEREPIYCVLTESEVTTRWLELRHVDEHGRIGGTVLDFEGHPIEISVQLSHDDMRSFLPGPGRFAVIARDAKGRIEGRNDYTVWQDGDESTPQNPAEIFRDERDAERKARKSIEAAAEQAKARYDEMHDLLAEQSARMKALVDEASRLRAKHELALDEERQRRLDAEEALAALRELADRAGGLDGLARLSQLFARSLDHG